MRALILGGRAPVALDHARRFRAQGAQVFVADSASCRLAAWSRSVSAAFRLPTPRDDLHGFGRELSRVIASERIDIVVPTCEEVFYLSNIRHLLPTQCNVFVAPFEQLRQLHSKWEFLSLAQGCGAKVPESQRVGGLQEARAWSRGRPVVLKPEYSRFGVHVRIFRDGIPAMPVKLPRTGPWIVQEFQRGREICSYSIAVAGELRAHVAYEPVHRLARSSSYYFEARCVPRIESFVERFVSKIGFTGQISFDWILGEEDVSVLECNPRAISGLHLFERDAPLPAVMAGELLAAV